MAPLLTRILNLSELEKNTYEAPRSHLCVQTALKTGTDNDSYGSCLARFSKNLPTALTQPEIVTENLSERTNIQVLFALVQGSWPICSPLFSNLQVSTTGLVPRKHSIKFRSIFHLSVPKSGVTSINNSISKEDHSW